MSWIDNLRRASFRGAQFRVEIGTQAGGRRVAMHEFPKKDIPYAEDMGRRARRISVTGYVIGPYYLAEREALLAACEREGPGTLILPLRAVGQYVCADYNCAEDKNKGGMATFEMVFVEAGAAPNLAPIADTAGRVQAAASAVGSQAATAGDRAIQGSTTATPAPAPAPGARGS